jgi:hypothetical protein
LNLDKEWGVHKYSFCIEREQRGKEEEDRRREREVTIRNPVRYSPEDLRLIQHLSIVEDNTILMN